MLKRTRVSSAPDISRIGAALARPGMDPRIWISLAVVRTFNFDSTHGPFADVMLLPSQLETTARVGSIYAGGGWGVFAPLRVDDEVLVAIPSGDPKEGAVVISRLWSAADQPPSQAVNNETDLVIVVQDGKNLRIDVSGGGTVQLNGGSDALALASKVEQALNTHVHVGVVPGGGSTGVVSAPVSGTGSSIAKVGG